MTITIEKPFIKETKLYVNLRNRTQPTMYIVVHCSATQNLEKYTWKDIDAMHRAKGWACIGYHYVIRTDGTIEEGRPLKAIGAHAKGYNNVSVGICLIGGIDANGKSVNNFTHNQLMSLFNLVEWLKTDALKPIAVNNLKVVGHRDLGAKKDCPCFDVIPWFTTMEQAYDSDNH